MPDYSEGGSLPFHVNQNVLLKHRRVNLTAGYLTYAGATDMELGTLQRTTEGKIDEQVQVRLRNMQGSDIMVASGTIAKYANVYGAADGKVSATSNANRIGIALNDAINDGPVEVVRVEQPEAAGSSSSNEFGISGTYWLRVQGNPSTQSITLDERDWRGRYIESFMYSHTGTVAEALADSAWSGVDPAAGSSSKMFIGAEYNTFRTVTTWDVTGGLLRLNVDGSDGGKLKASWTDEAGTISETQYALYVIASAQVAEQTHTITIV